jgi:hypothetical protein
MGETDMDMPSELLEKELDYAALREARRLMEERAATLNDDTHGAG